MIRWSPNLVGINVTLHCDAAGCERHLNVVTRHDEDLDVQSLREGGHVLGWGCLVPLAVTGKISDWCPDHKDQRGDA